MTRLMFLLLCVLLLWPLNRTVYGEATSSQTAVRLKIVEVNDLHISTDKDAAYPAKVIEAMNREGAQLALVVGDVANNGNEEELQCAKGVLDKLAAPYYIVRGNHDGTESIFQQVFGKDHTTSQITVRGIHFIFFDPGDKTTWDKKVAEPESLTRIREMVAAAPAAEPFVFCCHYPLGEGVQYRLKNTQEILDCFKDRKLLAAIAGHFHGNTERTKNGTLFTTTACASSARSNHDKTTARGYRVFTITEDMKITTEFREVPEEKR